MAMVEDRSVEEERDLAQMQIGAMMDTAGVGLATFQETSGWVRQRQLPGRERADEASVRDIGALQSISRDIVARRIDGRIRHAAAAPCKLRRSVPRCVTPIRHPQLGQRWLLTRVEPATLASGKRTTSVVTLDITEQHQTQQRSEQLLRELTTILESTSAGIAYIRGDVLVRCNRRFEAMLGLPSVGIAGSGIQELFGSSPQGQRIADETLQALSAGLIFETEFSMEPAAASAAGAPVNGSHTPGPTRWYALSVRRTGPVSEQIEAIAVLSDITRLKAQQVELEQLARDRELMFSLSEVGIAFLRDGVLQRVNDALAQLAGYPAAELQGLALSSLFADADEHERLSAQEQNALLQHGRWIGERQLHQRDGRVVWVQVSTRLVGDDPSGGVIASFVNVDARHRAEHAVALQAEPHTSHPGFGAGRHRHGRPARHRVDEPLGPPHVRRRSGRLHRPAHQHGGHARTRSPVPAHPVPRGSDRGRGRDLRMPREGARRARVLGGRQCGRHRSRIARTPAHLRVARHRAAPSVPRPASRRLRPRCSASSKPRRWRSRCAMRARCACCRPTWLRPHSIDLTPGADRRAHARADVRTR
jgi:PAS domain S-box-containing protein